jgi:hypothetical protein
MSLTSKLKQKDIFDKFKETFKIPEIDSEEIICPPMTKNYPLIGTAFDYLLRFVLEKKNPLAIKRKWIAEEALNMLEKNSNEYLIVKSIIQNSKKFYEEYLESGIITNELISSSIKLAKVDSIYRAGFFDPDMEKVEENDIIDLKNLVDTIPLDKFNSRKKCFLNPHFGEASQRIGGADADLIIDNTLIDIKTTKYFSINEDYYYQLIGYYILSLRGKINNKYDNLRIENVAIYFSRYGKIISFPVKKEGKMFGIPKLKFEKFLEWFDQEVLFHKEEGLNEEKESFGGHSFQISVRRKIPIFEKKKGSTKKLKEIIGYKIFSRNDIYYADRKSEIKRYKEELRNSKLESFKKRLTKQQSDFIFGDLKKKYKGTKSWNNWLNKEIK